MENRLNIYFTAGVPNLNSTTEIINILQSAGTNIMEIGIPYSDPVADGPIIQKAHEIALKNGMNISILLEQLFAYKDEIKIPIVLMSYFNPILQFGFEEFCKKCNKIGVKGLIIPDLPAYELERTYLEILNKYELEFSCLITPETPEERIHHLDNLSSGFLYAVSSSATTGAKKNKINTNYLEKLKSLKTKNPIMMGFGIATRDDFSEVCQYVSGGIIGTAFVRMLFDENWKEKTKAYLKEIIS